MSTFQLLLQGFAECMDPFILLMCAAGGFVGALVGVLPGLGPAATLAVLLPLIYGRPPLVTMVMLAGIYYGAGFGGAITSIALNIPGESSSVPTCFDGYPLQKQGKGGKAMGISMLSSFLGGTLGTILLTFLASFLAGFSLKFGPPEYFATYLFAFIAILCISKGSIVKGGLSLFLGLLLSTIGFSQFSASPRLDFGFIYLWNGVDFLPVAVGLLGLSEIYMSINEYIEIKKGDPSLKFKVKDVFPSLKEYISCLPTQIRCMVVGFFVGVLPGAGATIASMLSYKMEEQIASDRENFGKGSLQGVAAPEAANNACAGGAMVPMLSLGIPGSGTTAILLGALVMVGIQPGPGLFTKHADLVWGLISSMYIGNVMLVIMCIFLIPVFLWLLRISQKTLPVIVAVLCIVGTYSSQNSLFDVGVMFFFSVIGVCFKLLNIPVAPMLVAIILGKDIELRFMQSIVTFKGDLGLFFTRPISLVLFVMCLALFAFPVTRLINERKKRKEIPFG